MVESGKIDALLKELKNKKGLTQEHYEIDLRESLVTVKKKIKTSN